jgi:hypothetical protein
MSRDVITIQCHSKYISLDDIYRHGQGTVGGTVTWYSCTEVYKEVYQDQPEKRCTLPKL